MVPTVSDDIEEGPTMRKQKGNPDPESAIVTSAEFKVPGGRVTIAGSALAVITLVALVGMILVCLKLIDLSERAIEKPSEPRVTSPK